MDQNSDGRNSAQTAALFLLLVARAIHHSPPPITSGWCGTNYLLTGRSPKYLGGNEPPPTKNVTRMMPPEGRITRINAGKRKMPVGFLFLPAFSPQLTNIKSETLWNQSRIIILWLTMVFGRKYLLCIPPKSKKHLSNCQHQELFGCFRDFILEKLS